MRQHAVEFYSALFRKEDCNRECADELLKGLPQLSSEENAVLDANISLEELTAAVVQMAPGRAPGLDGLPVDLWALLEVFGSRPVGGAAGMFADCYQHPVVGRFFRCYPKKEIWLYSRTGDQWPCYARTTNFFQKCLPTGLKIFWN